MTPPTARRPTIRSPIENRKLRRALAIRARATGVNGASPELGSLMQDTEAGDEEFAVAVDAGLAGGRLDAVLAKALPAFSRNRIKDLILAGAAAINGQTALEPKTRVKDGDALVLTAPPPEDPDPEPEDIPLDILYEDDELLVVNKPVGMVVHPAPGSAHGTLVNALLFHCKGSLPGINGVKRPGIVHRLDKDTSGVMVAAKTERAMAHLAAQYADHGRTGPLHRAYAAFAWGQTQQGRGTVDAPLGRDQNSRLKQTVRGGGRGAGARGAGGARGGGGGGGGT